MDQYCNPLADVTLDGVSLQLDEIGEKVKKVLRLKSPAHPSLRALQGGLFSSKHQINHWVIGFIKCQ